MEDFTGGSRHRRLLPAPRGSGRRADTPGGTPVPAKKPKLPAACLSCRKAKAKCTGDRPSCGRCSNINITCEYDAEPNMTSALSLKRRYEDVTKEASVLKELIDMLTMRPETEALDVLRRLRISHDPAAVLNLVKEGSLLMQQRLNDGETAVGFEDAAALAVSTIKVPAKPWTSVAGDGLVSSLISSFFACDYVFYLSFIDREYFLADMRSGDLDTTTYCSPLLVNAICSLRSLTSNRAKRIGSLVGSDMRMKFLNEAKAHYNKENGTPSLCTVQALLIMYLCSAGMGKTRAGDMYRYLAYQMLRQLELASHLQEELRNPRDDGVDAHLRALTRALWGIYCFESISAFAYLQVSLVPEPLVPRLFAMPTNDISAASPTSDERIAPLLLDAMSDISQMLSKVMKYNTMVQMKDRGSDTDFATRVSFLLEVADWRRSLSPRLQMEENFSPGTYFLSAYANQVIIAALRPLPAQTRLPDNFGTAGDICIACCVHDIEGMEKYERDLNLLKSNTEYSIQVLYPLFNSSLTLINLLHLPQTQNPFARSCRLLSLIASDFPFAHGFLEVLREIADYSNSPIPPQAAKFFRGPQPTLDGPDDLPPRFALPRYSDMVRSLSDGGEDDGYWEKQLGMLVEKWNLMSLEHP